MFKDSHCAPQADLEHVTLLNQRIIGVHYHTCLGCFNYYSLIFFKKYLETQELGKPAPGKINET